MIKIHMHSYTKWSVFRKKMQFFFVVNWFKCWYEQPKGLSSTAFHKFTGFTSMFLTWHTGVTQHIEAVMKWSSFCILLKENYCTLIQISLFFHKILVSNTSLLAQIMAWYRTADKPLSEPIVAELTIVTGVYTHHSPPEEFLPIKQNISANTNHKAMKLMLCIVVILWLYRCHLTCMALWYVTFHKCHNASDRYITMHHFVTETCTRVHISFSKWCIVGNGTGTLWHYARDIQATGIYRH